MADTPDTSTTYNMTITGPSGVTNANVSDASMTKSCTPVDCTAYGDIYKDYRQGVIDISASLTVVHKNGVAPGAAVGDIVTLAVGGLSGLVLITSAEQGGSVDGARTTVYTFVSTKDS